MDKNMDFLSITGIPSLMCNLLFGGAVERAGGEDQIQGFFL